MSLSDQYGGGREMLCETKCSGKKTSSCLDSGSGEDSLDRLLPGPPITAVRRKSTSQTKTELPLLRTCTHTIYTAGRPPWVVWGQCLREDHCGQ
nr:uridine-cytidine kinase-like 1 [Oncorhynchus nerka]